MTDLLFSEDGVLGPDISGRVHAPGSQKVYVNRGGILPRRPPRPKITALYDGQVIESDHWKITVRKVHHQPGYMEAYGFRLETDEGILAYSGDTG
jgi:L-ascorbate metabolism protein UlaG (beta-lactamase superfamily)